MKIQLGAHFQSKETSFCVWAPFAEKMTLKIVEPEPAQHDMEQNDQGYWHKVLSKVKPGTKYKFAINGQDEKPDPASKAQPDGVHGPSVVVDLNYQWTDQHWKNLPLQDYIIYELHVGAFTPQRTFAGVIEKLDYLLDLGINAIEIMPVSQFPGERNWGYDGAYPFATQINYGAAAGLQLLVDACHAKGIAVILDVVYNHMGPEGNYLSLYGPYFTEKYQTPWGKALNFDDEYSDEVRNFFLQNALMWLRDFHIDALRLDAIHAIKDFGARHFMKELSREVKKMSEEVGVPKILIGESDLNDVRFIDNYDRGGYGLDGQWIDEFHHAIHALVTGEKKGYYEDFGNMEQLATSFQKSYVYSGRYSPHRKKTFGNDASHTPFSQFVVFGQNHDQVGNRMLGERINQLVDFEASKLVAATFLLSPMVPLLFMGEEYAEENPFLYFVSHTDPDLVEAVRQGRKKEFEAFHLEGDMPDPQSEASLAKSSLQWNKEKSDIQAAMFNWYKRLIRWRKEHAAWQNFSRQSQQVKAFEQEKCLAVFRTSKDENSQAVILFNYSKQQQKILIPWSMETFEKKLDSSAAKWQGTGTETRSDTANELTINPLSAIIFDKKH